MLLTLLTIFLTIIAFKLMDNSKATQFAQEIRNLKLKIESLQMICKKYEQEFGTKESLRILSKIENNFQDEG